MYKEVGVIGLGKMGANLSRRLVKKGWDVYGFNRTTKVTEQLEKEGIKGVYSLKDFVSKLKKPRILISIVTAGKATSEMLDRLSLLLEPDDIIADFSNSFYKDSQKHAKMLAKRRIKYIDVGISGGPGGALNGACLMVGGDKETFKLIEPLLKDEAAENSYMHFSGIGAGHFIKMVHNGIEYGMMQSIAEGFNLLKNGPYKNLKMTDIAAIYQRGSVIESRLVEWLSEAFKKYGDDLEGVSGSVGFTGEGEWTAKVGKKLKFPIKIIFESVKFRKESQKKPSFTGKILTAMRNMFGGHSIERGKMT